jgi:uncharacterized protein YecA (UPF0149 family)
MEMSRRVQAAMASAVMLSVCSDVSVAAAESTVSHNLYRGRNVTRDFGKPRVRTQPRNSLCVCGSGKKSKRCCVTFPGEG